MHNTSNSPCAYFFGNLSVLQHGSLFLLNFNDNIAFESRHLCLLVDFNFPKTDWSTVTSSYARKTSYLNNLNEYELCSAFLSFTHRGGNLSTTFSFPHLLQDFLTASCSHSLRSQIMLPYQQRFTPNPHHPFLGIRNYAPIEPCIVTFSSLWQSYTFYDCTSADKVADFYHYLHPRVRRSLI